MPAIPFSLTPTNATGPSTPGKASEATAPPSSSTRLGRMPRSVSNSTAAAAPVPFVSSFAPENR